jgi:NAD(P)-dependent dehydrogenase (short-subunit alcohol dehydrogenase family)
MQVTRTPDVHLYDGHPAQRVDIVQAPFTKEYDLRMTNVASVIVFGASGNVGHYVVPALLEAGVKVTVATRADSTASFPPGAQVATADYKSLASLTSIIRGHESVISLVGPAALTDQKHLIDAAIAAGATYFIPSEFGHDVTDERVVPLLPVANAKRAVTAYLCEKEKEGLSWTSIVTALFFDWVRILA